MPSEDEKKEEGLLDRLFRSMFSNDNIDLQGEIHKKLNQDEEFRKRFPPRQQQQQQQSPSLHQDLMRQMMTLGRGEANSMTSSYSSYQMHQDDQHGVQVTVDVPGVVSSDDLKVQVLQTQTPNLNCVVQWSGQRPTNHPNVSSSFSERVRLDPSVDCDHLAANLSRGVLRLSAPIILKGKEQPTVEKEEARSIPITEHED